MWLENWIWEVKNEAGCLLTFPYAVWIDIPHDFAIILLLILCLPTRPTFIISTFIQIITL